MPRRLSDVWVHFKVLYSNGRKKHGSCIYCEKEYKYSNSTRLATHIVRCEKCPDDIKNIFKEQLPRSIAIKIFNAEKRFVHRKIVRKKLRQRHIVWEHFKVTNGSAFKKYAVCNYCETELRDSSIVRLLDHLYSCEGCPEKVKNTFDDLDLECICPNNSYDPRILIKKSRQRPTVWEHFRILDQKGYKKHVACQYCNMEYKYSNATRLVIHLCRCPKCPDSVKEKYLDNQESVNNTEDCLDKLKKRKRHNKYIPIKLLAPKASPGGKPSSDVWQYFSILSGVGYKKHGSCNFCGKEYHHCNATRLLKHIIECAKTPKEIKNKYLAEDSSSEDSDDESIAETSPEPCRFLETVVKVENNTDGEEDAVASPSNNNSEIDPLDDIEANLERCTKTAVNNDVKNHIIDMALTKAMYTSGLCPNVLESMAWKNVFHLLRPDYGVPTTHDLNHRLLDAEVSRVYKNIESEVQNTNIITLGFDLMKLNENESLLLYTILMPKPLCYRILWTEKQKIVEKNYVYEETNKIINEIGFSKIVALMSEEDSNHTVTEICGSFPQITPINCLFTNLYKTYQDIVKEPIMASPDVKILIDYLNESILPLLVEPNDEEYRKIINSLKLPSTDDWEGYFKCLQVLLENRNVFQTLATTFEYMDYNKVLSLSEAWWECHHQSISLLKPIIEALKAAQSVKGVISEVPAIFYKLESSLDKEISLFSENSLFGIQYIQAAFESCKKTCMQPIHMAANLLDPRYIGSSLNDNEIAEAMSYISQYATSISDDPGVIMKNLAEFKTKSGYFVKVDAIWNSVHMIKPRIWWKSFCSHLKITPIAVQLLSIPYSLPEYKTRLLTENLQWNNQQDKDEIIKRAILRINYHFQNKFNANDEISNIA